MKLKPPHIFVVTAAASPVDSGKLLGKMSSPGIGESFLENPCEALKPPHIFVVTELQLPPVQSTPESFWGKSSSPGIGESFF